MSKIYYYYGAMNSSKTANLLMAAHNYIEQGKIVICLKPEQDIRWGNDKITSRLGISMDCTPISENMDIVSFVKTEIARLGKLDCIFIDEAQFLSKSQVEQFVEIADNLSIPIMCYGLKNTYQKGTLFEGSSALVFYADKISEIKTMCAFCNKKASMNLHFIGKNPVYSGDIIAVGDINPESDTSYTQTCRYHYNNPPKRD